MGFLKRIPQHSSVMWEKHGISVGRTQDRLQIEEWKTKFNQHKMNKKFFIYKKSQSEEFKIWINVGGQKYICVNL